MSNEMNIVWNVFPLNKGRTKWEVLEARRMAVRKALSDIEREMTGLEQTPCRNSVGEPLSCGSCGAVHETEKDFADHYIVRDERYLNLGECPSRVSRPDVKGKE